MIEHDGHLWIDEPTTRGMRRLWRVDAVLHEETTPFQDVLVAVTEQGASLFCGGERQSTEFSQLVYHEALVIPPALLADRLDRCLVIGSSEGVACQILVAAGAQAVDHVDIDRRAVRICADHLPYGYTVTELTAAERGAGPIRMRYEDGYAFLESAAGYDVIVVDLPDESPEGDAQHDRLYGTAFLEMCRKALAPGGVVSTQAGCMTMWRNDTLRRSWDRFTRAFPSVVYYGSDEHEWAFVSARADDLADPVGFMRERLARLPYRPVSIDDAALTGNTVPPRSVRN
ncbi:hypothetical protein [Herbidospora galbida]|nr:hypothetical protein [Herbidospora galbida]